MSSITNNQTKKTLFFCVLIWFVAIIIINYPDSSNKNKGAKKYNVGLLIMATGKYISFVEPLLKSAATYFLPNQNVTYFIFTDGDVPKIPNVVKINQPQLGWPYDSMMRFATYYQNRNALTNMDYLFSCDADMRFVDFVGDEILQNRVATIHSNYMFDQKPYETNPLSTACINRGNGKHYFAGAFYGGTKTAFLHLARTNAKNIDIDLARGIIALVNDESHLNKYFVDHKPTTILSPSYCHFAHWHSSYPRKLLALDDKAGNIRQRKVLNPLDYYKRYLKNEAKK